jgi:hypothetical protein
MSELAQWTNFYIIMSVVSSTLIGLLFVVITFAPDRRNVNDRGKISAYLTPTIVHFSTILLIAAVLSFPNHTKNTAAYCICTSDFLGLIYGASLLSRKSIATNFFQVGDQILYIAIPLIIYCLFIFAGVLLLYRAQLGLTILAVGMGSLLCTAIRNSWAMAVFIASRQPTSDDC